MASMDIGSLASFLADLRSVDSPQELAALTVDQLRTSTGARWAEVVQTDRSGGLTTLAAVDPGLTEELQHCRATAGEPPAPGDPALPPTLVLDDLGADSPWPRFAAMAVDRTPVRSAVLTYAATHDTAVVVPVHDDRPGFFTPRRQQSAELVAQLAGLALTRLAMTEALGHLQAAVDSRQHVGTAVGVLVARHGLTPEAAFDLLRVRSSHTNRKLRHIASDVIHDGDLLPREPPRTAH